MGVCPEVVPDRSVGENLLVLDGFGVAFGERVVLSSVTLTLPRRGVTVLMGPGGTGKSTLVRTIAGFNSANPSLRTWGDARYAGAALGDGERPALVSQSARLMVASVFENLAHDLPGREHLTRMQQRNLIVDLLARANLAALTDRIDEPVARLPLGVQRRLAILRLVAAEPALLCVDEPTTGVDEENSRGILDFLRAESERRAVLVVLHNQQHARSLGGNTALLAGGVIQESQPTDALFDTPCTKAGHEFARNGTCAVPAPDADPAALDEQAEALPPLPEPACHYPSGSFGPRGFLWLKKGVLAGTPRPGIVADLDYDMRALRRVGVTVLVSLTLVPMEPRLLSEYGIRGVWSPIRDMGAPGLEQAREICRRIAGLVAQDEVVAVHCRAGLGRTGTVLAAYLIWEGRAALDALDTVRRVEPKWVQSDEQVAFLEEFAQFVANDAGARSARVAGLAG